MSEENYWINQVNSWTGRHTADRAPQPPTKAEPAAPVTGKSFTPAAALRIKQAIHTLYDAGLITSDKRRGMKMVITKATIGWRPGAR